MAKKVILISVISFAVFFFIDEFYFKILRQELNELIGQMGISHILAYSLVGIPIFAGILLLHKKKGFLESLGLNRSVLTGLIFSLVCTLPMFLIYPIFYDFNTEISLNQILIVGVAAGFFEELYFRGFLFGQFYRYTNFGFFSSAFLASLLVGVGHLFLGSDVVEIALIFFITFISGLIFGWVYSEWNFNLWVPVFLHIFINLSWEMFAIKYNYYANFIRLATVILIVVLTFIYKKRKGLPMEITREHLIMKKSNFRRVWW